MIKKKYAIKKKEKLLKVAIAGNPNVGKSTIFNALTGMHQHTGNWPGKTVSNAVGYMRGRDRVYQMIDIPGTYSLYPNSAEEEIARDFLISNDFDAVLIVCDAGCIEKNLGFVLQVTECCKNVLICVNLIDEAKKKGIVIDVKKLSKTLNIPVVDIVAHKKNGIKKLKNFIEDFFDEKHKKEPTKILYSNYIEEEIERIEKTFSNRENSRFFAIKILEGEREILKEENIEEIINSCEMSLKIKGYSLENVRNEIRHTKITKANFISQKCKIVLENSKDKDVILDKFLTGKYTAIPIMLIMVAFVFWVTIEGANFLSGYLSNVMFFLEDKLYIFLNFIKVPNGLSDAITFGGFRILGWVVSVMLPPMAIFFPFFTILEDTGYLARIAYNLDKPFYRCNACGKQALTMCMGFGCNSVGVTGARIIDSGRERILAILTNNFMPCNGRFPMLITFITIYFLGVYKSNYYESFFAAILLALLILFAILVSFAVTKMLSVTILKGVPSSYILELPSYRKPEFSKVIVRSLFDRTLFVLGRAVAVALPAGFVIWILGNVKFQDNSILVLLSQFLNPIGVFLGLDGVILLCFILGTPANEIVVPLMLMTYLQNSTISEIGDYAFLEKVLSSNGWDIKKAVCVVIFTIFHWPCATTILTIKKETGSLKWTFFSILIPTSIGALLCIIINYLLKIVL